MTSSATGETVRTLLLLAVAGAPAAPPAPPPPVDADELVSAVQGILASANLPMSVEQQTLVGTNVRLQAQLEASAAAVARERDRSAALSAELETLRVDAFLCQICQAREITHVLVPCGHTLCGGCLGRIVGQARANQRRCPFDRQPFTSSIPFRKPGGI